MPVNKLTGLTAISQVGNELKLTQAHIASLKEAGIVSLMQLQEILSVERHDFSFSYSNVSRALTTLCGDSLTARTVFMPIQPLTGVSPVACEKSATTHDERRRLEDRLEKAMKKITFPSEFSLGNDMPDVLDQGNFGACTGFATATTLEYLKSDNTSPGFAYRGGKLLDGLRCEGSFLRCCYQFLHEYGAVDTSTYSYQDCLDDRDITPLLPKAKKCRAQNYIDLKVSSHLMPDLLKATLTGTLLPKMSPRPVSVSVATYDCWNTYSAQCYGLIRMPLSSETRRGGHALTLVGWTSVDHVKYWILQNSWSERWATQSPVKPGYALIPEKYFSGELLWEAFVPLDV